MAAAECELRDVSKWATYGWSMTPVGVQIDKTQWKTSLWRKDGLYLAPVKLSVRKTEGLEKGDSVTVRREIGS